MLSSYTSFIDHANNRANFDSEEFINILEIAARFPELDDFPSEDREDEYALLYRGDQLFVRTFLHWPGDFQYYQTMLGDIVAIGYPSPTGGQHIIDIPPVGIGITAGSSHEEAAWSFIRRFLLPDADVDTEFWLTLNIESFEARITELMTPDYWEETNPEIGAVEGEERPIEFGWPGLSQRFYMYAMTEDEADAVRDIVQSASISFQQHWIIMDIILEDSYAFFNGARSAEDTARIIQNRVQTYLNEQS
jgi:multiple sugar transport system substrate-binding protein